MNADYQIKHNKAGETLLNAINSLTQSVKIHSNNNDLLIQSAQKFIRLLALLGQKTDLVSIQHARELLFFQKEKVAIRPANTRLFNRVLQFLENREIYGFHFKTNLQGIDPQKIIAFFRMTEQAIAHDRPSRWLAAQCLNNEFDWVSVDQTPPAELSEPYDSEADDAAKKAQVRKVYAYTLSAVKNVARKLTSDQNVAMRQSVRMAQKMVDIISEDESLFLGISTMRVYDDYTYVHSLNVAILAMCLGKRIGLSHSLLEQLGLCGLFHDLGKAALPKELLNKEGAFSPEEFAMMKTHSTHSARLILKFKAKRDRKVKLLVPPFEHHMGYDLSGYPKADTGPSVSLFGRILTIVDVYDAITSPRIYRQEAVSPSQALVHMAGRIGTQFDPILLKVFINMLGAYPVGTLLQLDNGEMGIVIKPSAGSDRTRPVVQLLVSEGPPGKYKKDAVVDLSEHAPDNQQYYRNIMASMHPSAMGIQAAEFLL